MDSVTLGQAFLLELSFALGLDPRQATLFSPTVGPALVGLSVGMLIFASAGLGFSGYSGPSFNPARCLAFSVARNNWDSMLSSSIGLISTNRILDQWIFWVAPMAASVVQSVMYHLVPPFHLLSSSEDKSSWCDLSLKWYSKLYSYEEALEAWVIYISLWTSLKYTTR